VAAALAVERRGNPMSLSVTPAQRPKQKPAAR
jgi:hypothetical protein